MISGGNHPSKNICIVSSECVGPFKNGGIGTSMTGLAEALAHNGHSVVLFYTRGAYLTNGKVKNWRETYAKNKIDFHAVRPSDLKAYGGPLVSLGYLTPSVIVDFLSNKHFDFVHFNDTDGEGYLAHALHSAGLLLPEATFQTNIHSPREWVGSINEEQLLHPIDLPMRSAERFSIANSDLICGPSQYLLDWIKQRGYLLPKNVVQQQYVMPRDVVQRMSSAVKPNSATATKIKRIVFFGRLEERKGLRLFLNAISLISDQLAQQQIEVAFLGRSVMIEGKSSHHFIDDIAKNWPLKHDVISDKGQQEALDYLAESGTLTVIASPADNSPCTVYECLLAQIPFVAANTGGIPELIAHEFHENVLFEHNSSSLSETLLGRLNENSLVPMPAVSQEENETRWLKLHDEYSSKDRKVPHSAVDLDELLILVDATLGKKEETNTLNSFVDAGFSNSNIAILKSNTSGSGLEVYLDAEGALSRIQQHEGPILVIGAGLLLHDKQALQTVCNSLLANGVDGYSCSSIGPNSRRFDHPGVGPAVSFCYGPSVPQCSIYSSGKNLIADYCLDSAKVGPAFGLLDQFILSGKSFWPIVYPFARADKADDPLSSYVPMTDERLKAYSNLASHEQAGILNQAAVGTKANLKMMIRKTVFQIASSRASFLVPWISTLREKLKI